MFAIRQIIEDPQEMIAIPPEFRHRRTEVIFMALDQEPDADNSKQRPTLASLVGCWEKEAIEPDEFASLPLDEGSEEWEW